MENEDVNSGPWIRVSAKKRARVVTVLPPDVPQGVANFDPNSFDNLNLNGSSSEEITSVPGASDRPQKRKRKDGKKVSISILAILIRS
jgi:hypothetical protein